MASPAAASSPRKNSPREKYVGKTLHEVPTPSVVLDLAKLEVNCERMLAATDKLGLQWRAHIKTHKTTELTRLQVGDSRDTPVYLCVSTVKEAEMILPLLQEYRSRGRHVNVLYGFPVYPSAVPRLADVSSQLGPGGLSLMIDHPDQLPCAAQIAQEAGHPPLVFLKLDTGYGRAGLPPASPAFAALVDAVLAAEAGGALRLHGLYSHAGHSYDCRDVWDPMSLLASEFAGLQQAAEVLRRKEPAAAAHPLVLTVGATPTTTTIQHPDLLGPGRARAGAPDQAPAPPTHTIAAQFAALRTAGFALEVHAGVYPTLDLQQLATHARDARLLAAADVAISVVAEVASVYAGRGAAGTAEALVNAGSLALGREPVKDAAAAAGHYAGWGVVMPWAGLRNEVPGERFPRRYGGLCVGKISQEHGILAWGGAKEDEPVLAVGQRVRIWPNHACVAGAGFDHYLIVDSRNTDKEDVVVDVWSRWQGW